MNNIFLFGIIFLSLVFPRRDCLQQDELNALGRSIRPEKDIFAISPSGHFYIHYDITGNDAPSQIDNNSNGIPDYVDEVGIAAEHSLDVIVNQLGLNPHIG